MPPCKGWAAVYCRLSKEDEEKTARESESIRNQRANLRSFWQKRSRGSPVTWSW